MNNKGQIAQKGLVVLLLLALMVGGVLLIFNVPYKMGIPLNWSIPVGASAGSMIMLIVARFLVMPIMVGLCGWVIYNILRG